MCHISQESVEVIKSFYHDRIISNSLWPPQSPDFTSPDFFLWGYLKESVYRNKLRTTEAVKGNIQLEIVSTENDVLQQTAYKSCLVDGGGHFQHLM
jgi:hypothetical protein